MTRGEYRVGVSFNPSADDRVGKIKRAAADLIDLIDGIPAPAPNEWADDVITEVHRVEVARCKALAQTHIEDAAMWAVKAATKPAFNKN